MPVLSVVIPTFDTAAMTLRCCRAVLAAAPDATEVIVSDDGSTDGTAELLAQQLPQIRVTRLPSNRGFAAAANQGLAGAAGTLVLLLNSDCVVEPEALRAFVRAFDDDPELGVAGARLLNDDGTPQWSGGRTPRLVWMLGVVSGAGAIVGSAVRFVRRRSVEAVGPVDWVSGAAMMFRREVWRDCGPLSEAFRFYCQDIEFCIRARALGWGVRIVPGARVAHGLGGTIAPGSPQRHDPEKLWPDLLTWGRRHHGKRWALLARPALVAAVFARIAWSFVRSAGRGDARRGAMLRAMRRLVRDDV